MKKILIISGGISKERAISLDTGRQVAKELKKNDYLVKITEPNFQLFDVIKKRMRYANSDIVRQVNGSYTKDLSQMQMEEPHLVQPFMEFVSFCNRYCDDVHCGPQNPPQGNNWQQNEKMMAQEGSKLGFSIADCSVICVEILG